MSHASSSSAEYEPLSEEEKERRERLERRKTELNEGVGRGESQKERPGRATYSEERKRAAATLIQARARGQAARRKLVLRVALVRVASLDAPRVSAEDYLSPPPSPPPDFTPVGPEQSVLPASRELPAPSRFGRLSKRTSNSSSRSSTASYEESTRRDESTTRRRGPAFLRCCRSKKPKFFPFPAFCRWPTLPVFVGLCCMTGIIKNGVAILAVGGAPLEVMAIAIGSLSLAAALMALLWMQLILFSRRHRRSMWTPEKPAITPHEVADPALRLVSTVRQRILSSKVINDDGSVRRISRRSSRRMDSKPALNRNRGAFGSSNKKETEEPARTERLLARPFVLFSRVGPDAMESIAITVLFKCRGDRAHSMAYHLTKLLAQLTVVALASCGTALAMDSVEAHALVFTTLSIQTGIAAWIFCACPSIDRIDNLVQALSWGIECLSTTMLVIALWMPTANLEIIALLLSLGAMALPIVKLAYEALFAPIGNLLLQCIDGKRSANPFNKKARLWMFRLVMTLVQKFACMGCGGGGGGDDDVDMGAVNKATSGTGIADAATAYEGADVEVEAEAPEAEMEGAEGPEGTEAVEEGAGMKEDDSRRRARKVFAGAWTAMMIGRGGQGALAPTAEQLGGQRQRQREGSSKRGAARPAVRV